MTAVALLFDSSGDPPVFDFRTPATGFTTSVQNALVCLGTRIGSDRVYVDRGTSLLAEANQGGFTNINMANTAASFAANEVLIFNQLTDDPNNVYRLTDFKLTSVSISQQTLFLSASISDANGDSAGISAAM